MKCPECAQLEDHCAEQRAIYEKVSETYHEAMGSFPQEDVRKVQVTLDAAESEFAECLAELRGHRNRRHFEG